MTKQKPNLQTGGLNRVQKAEVVKYAEKNPQKTHDDIAQWAQKEFNLAESPHRTTIGRILASKHEFINLSIRDHTIKRARVVKYSVLNRATVN